MDNYNYNYNYNYDNNNNNNNNNNNYDDFNNNDNNNNNNNNMNNAFQDFFYGGHRVLRTDPNTGNMFILAGYGPFPTPAHTQFTEMHLLQNNIRNYQIQDHDFFSRTLNEGDMNNRATLTINDVEFPGRVGNIVKVWSPYTYNWWEFEHVIDTAAGNYLKGWAAYISGHDLVAGDQVNFKTATNVDMINANEFVLAHHVKMISQVPNHRIPMV